MTEFQVLDSRLHNRNADKVKREEEELKKLIAQEYGGGEESAEEDVTEQVAPQREQPKATEQEESDEGLSAEEKTFKKRYADLRDHLRRKDEEHKAEIEKIKEQLEKSARKELVLPKTREEIEAWQKKYPDVAAIIEAIADKKAEERTATLDTRMQEIEEMRIEAQRQKAEAEMLRRHPDFFEIRDDDAFHEWAAKQPSSLQKALYEDPDNVSEVAWAIDMYKTAMGIKTKKAPSQDKAAASSVKTRSATRPEADESKSYLSESVVNRMSLKEYEARQEEIMDAMRSGKFIYDVTKK